MADNPFAQYAPKADNPFAQFSASPDPSAGQDLTPQYGGVAKFAPPMSLQAAPAKDVANSFGAGMLRGGMGLAMLTGNLEQLARSGINKAAEMYTGNSEPVVSPKAVLGTSADLESMVNDGLAAAGKQPLYKPTTVAGQYADTAGQFVPGMLAPGTMTQRVIGNVAAPAIASETAGQLTQGTSIEPVARMAGALAGGKFITPNAIQDPVRAKAVQTLADEGVTAVTAGQTTGKMPLRWTEQAVADLPFVGKAQKFNDKAGDQFTAAALRRIGVNETRASADVIDAAYQRIGKVFDDVGRQAAVPVSQKIVNEVDQIASRYNRGVEPAFRNGLPDAVANDIKQLFNPNSPSYMTGQQYTTWRSQIGEAARGTNDPRTSRALYDLQKVLDDGAEKFLQQRGAPQLAEQFKEARSQYRNLLVISKAVSNGEKGALGIITPSALETATRQMQGVGQYTRGKGDLTDLARSGSAILRPLPQSGTAPRAAVSSALAAVGGTVGGAPGALGGIVGPAVAGNIIMSPIVQGYLKNQMLRQPALANPGLLGQAVNQGAN